MVRKTQLTYLPVQLSCQIKRSRKHSTVPNDDHYKNELHLITTLLAAPYMKLCITVGWLVVELVCSFCACF